MPEDFNPLDGFRSIYWELPDGTVEQLVPASELPRIKAQALREAAAELHSQPIGPLSHWHEWAAKWLRRRAQRVEQETVGG